MKTAWLATLLTCALALAAVPAAADDSAESVTTRLLARAGAPPAPVLERPELRDVPVAERLFYMRSTEIVRCVEPRLIV